MPAFLLLDRSNVILEAYSGPAENAPDGSIGISADLYAQIPLRMSGWTYIAPNGETPGSVSAPTLPVSPGPTLAQLAEQAILAGLTVTLNGSVDLGPVVFPTDPDTQIKLSGVISVINTIGGFPDGSESYPLKDASGAWHALTLDQYKAVAAAIAGYVAPLDLIIDGNPLNVTELPNSSVTLTV